MSENVNKCPSCGAPRDSYAAVCDYCGHEFKGESSSEVMSDFTTKLEKLDQNFGPEKSSNFAMGCLMVCLWLCCFPIMFAIFIIKIIKDKHANFTGLKAQKAEAIRNFIVPNSREALLEFSMFIENHVQPINFLSALTTSGLETQRWNKVWIDKANQTEQKANLALKNDPETLSNIRQSCQRVNSIYKKNETIFWISLGVMAAIFVAIIVIASIR